MSSKAHKSDVQETKIPSRQRSRKFMNVTVYFLDDSSHVFQLQAKNLGQVLFDKVCKHINLLEVDYFGLECEDEKGTKFWLDVLKPLCSQLPTSFPTMYFCVKFYTPDPAQLEDEFTRYLFSLQIKKDLTSGALQCNDNTVAVLISYIVQADFGDFIPEKCIDHSYLSSYKFVPYQNQELEKKVMENHKKILGQTPAEADLNLLETARRCELYGVKMTAAKDQEGGPLNLAAVHIGVLVFQNFTKINTFSWVKIRKLSFKRKKFLIKLHPEAYYKDTVEYTFEGRNECKNFWKKCIENHTFFRCTDAKQGMRLKPKIFSRGSSFRYSGRTQKQVSEYVREQCIKRSPFQRSTSLKTPTSPTKSIGSGSAIIPQPLLPVTSLSCGSISDISKDTIPVPKATSEPSTPHTTQDFSKAINGSYSKDSVVTPISGVVSPEIDQEGFQSPDFGRQDTDDNLSHDSYHVLEKEVQSANLTAATNSADLSNNKSHESLSNNKEDEGKCSKDVSSNLKSVEKGLLLHKEDDESKRKSHRHRVKVFSNHVDVGQTSPILYARANRHQSYNGPDNRCKAYPRTVDFVMVNQLPAIGSFSYKDDSVELKSPSRLKLEFFHQKWKSQEDQEIRGTKLSERRARSKSQPLPLGVDLLTDLLPLSPPISSNVPSAEYCRKETALNVVANNLDNPSSFKNTRKEASTSHEPSVEISQLPCKKSLDIESSTVYVTDTIRRKLSPESTRKARAYQNFYQMVYLDMMSEGDFVDRSTHYNYNTYKFSQIGRPPELLRSTSTQNTPSDSHFDSHLT